jgi:hypothetical protein
MEKKSRFESDEFASYVAPDDATVDSFINSNAF